MHPRLATIAVLGAVLVACSSTVPSDSAPSSATAGPGPSQSPAPSMTTADATATYAAIASQVEKIRALQPTASVAPVLIDEAQLRTNLEADFDRSNPGDVLAASERTLKTLGLLPAAASLRQQILDLQSGQVAGYYSPKQNELFVVSRSGGIGPTERVTYAHEFTHELQDQHFDLDRLGLDAPDQSDRSLARLSLVEGDAVSVQQTWMGQSLTPEELGQLQAAALEPGSVAAIVNAPAILRETSLFPYLSGFAFVEQLIASGGYTAVDAAFGRPPDSTEQILHPEKYASREVPVTVTPATDLADRVGTGWKAAGQDTLGELQLRVWLHEGNVPASVSQPAAAGWGGDRLVLLEGPGDATVVVIESAWDSATDATEFADAARSAITGHALHGEVVHRAGSTKVSLAIGDDVTPLIGVLPG
jgi:hypothetical protein